MIRLRWGDGVVVALATALVTTSFALSYAPAAGPTHLVVTQAGTEPRHYPLNESRTIRVQGVAGITEIEIQSGRARCLRSPGSRGICEAAGWLERPGDMAVSLPNRLTLQVQGPQRRFDSMHY
ncbi:NusG domain II-containing protein [Thioalkalivibrio sp.]|uniref:NusG domain II-containing protein n=1 Tax=Thioalkalivibrio sp. TaxID=2093813 RepID=UPI003975C2CD